MKYLVSKGLLFYRVFPITQCHLNSTPTEWMRSVCPKHISNSGYQGYKYLYEHGLLWERLSTLVEDADKKNIMKVWNDYAIDDDTLP